MCPAGIWMSVSRLLWVRIVAECEEVSSQTGSTMTTKKGVVVSVDEARRVESLSSCPRGRIPGLRCTSLLCDN
jgi:hypothetical protein